MLNALETIINKFTIKKPRNIPQSTSIGKCTPNHILEIPTNTIHKPTDEYDEDYFWLGVIDGDGSLGMKGDGHPYINLTTKSEQLKEDFLDYIEKLTNFRPSVSKNKRDNIYNITVGSKKAQIIAKKA